MSALSTVKMNRAEIVKWIVSFALTAIFLVIPEQGIYTTQVKWFMMVTVFWLALAAFELVHVLFISIALPACYVLFSVAPAAVVMAPWLSTTFLMVVGAVFLATTLEDCGILRRIGFWLMCQVKGSYFLLLSSIMVVGVLLNILTSGNGYLVLAAMTAGLCASLNGMQNRLGAGLATAVLLGGATSHAYTYQSTNWAVIFNMAGGRIGTTDITPLSIIIHNWPLFFLSLVILFIVAKWYKPEIDMDDISYFRNELQAMGSITRKEKVNLIMMVVLLTYLFTISIHKIDLNLGFALIPWMVLLPFMRGADEKTVQKMNFSIVFFVAGCMAIGTVAGSLNLGEAIAQMCRILIGSSTGAIPIMGVVFGIVFGLNFLMTPLAIYALIIDPILTLAISMGYSPIPFAYAVNACSEAIILPYEYVPYLFIYSFGMISMKDFIKVNILRSIIFFGGFLLVLVPYWMLIGLL